MKNKTMKIYLTIFAILILFFCVNICLSNFILDKLSTIFLFGLIIYVIIFIGGYLGIPLNKMPQKYQTDKIYYITNKKVFKRIMWSKKIKTSKASACASNLFKRCVFFFSNKNELPDCVNNNSEKVEIELKINDDLMNRAKIRLIDGAIFIADDIDLSKVEYSAKFMVNIKN